MGWQQLSGEKKRVQMTNDELDSVTKETNDDSSLW